MTNQKQSRGFGKVEMKGSRAVAPSPGLQGSLGLHLLDMSLLQHISISSSAAVLLKPVNHSFGEIATMAVGVCPTDRWFNFRSARPHRLCPWPTLPAAKFAGLLCELVLLRYQLEI